MAKKIISYKNGSNRHQIKYNNLSYNKKRIHYNHRTNKNSLILI